MAEELYEYIISKCKEQIPVVERGNVWSGYEGESGK